MTHNFSQLPLSILLILKTEKVYFQEEVTNLVDPLQDLGISGQQVFNQTNSSYDLLLLIIESIIRDALIKIFIKALSYHDLEFLHNSPRTCSPSDNLSFRDVSYLEEIIKCIPVRQQKRKAQKLEVKNVILKP